MSEQFWYLLLLVAVPLISGLLCFVAGTGARIVALLGALVSLVIVGLLYSAPAAPIAESSAWIPSLGAHFSLGLGGNNYVLVLLNALVFPLIYLVQWQQPVESQPRFYGLMMLTMAGMTGVFLAQDLLLFYCFWELALIPVYFLASLWGGKERMRAAFKFFIYTFVGSLLMLGGVLYLYSQSATQSFDYQSILEAGRSLDVRSQQLVFWLFFIAFAIKMPIFPFHTWQPDTYQQAIPPVVVVLSAVMVKMGIFATMYWLVPMLPQGFAALQTVLMILCTISIVYASLLAIRQSNIKKLLAYSSIAHIGLMALGIFSNTDTAAQGALLQMFNHGIIMAGLWLMVGVIEQQYGTQDLRQMGGMATLTPLASIFLVLLTFANISLPFTSGFPGEFMLYQGIFASTHPGHIVFMVIAASSIIFAAVYMLRLLQRVVWGPVAESPNLAIRLSAGSILAFTIIGAIILAVGVYPQLILQLIRL